MSIKKPKLSKIKPFLQQRATAFANEYSWQNLSLRSKIYFVICMYAVIVFVIFPVVSSAVLDVLGFGVHDLYASITSNVRETNELLNKAFEFSLTSPFEVVNSLGLHNFPRGSGDFLSNSDGPGIV